MSGAEQDANAADVPIITLSGNSGTDKTGSRKRSIVYYSDKPVK